jgi:hypothetical protein
MKRKEGRILGVREFILKYGFGIAVLLLVIDGVVLFFSKSSSQLSFFADVINVVISASVAVMAFFCYAHLPKKFLIEKNFFLILFVAFVLRFIGEALWTYYDIYTISMPSFSLADVAWMLSNFALLFGFEYKLSKTPMPHKKAVIIIFTLALLSVAGLFVYGVYLKLLVLTAGTELAYLINESYVIFDLFTLILIATPLYLSIIRKDKSFYFYLFMAFGFTAVVIYDFLFANMALEGTYFSGGRIENLYFTSYFLLYCAFYFKYKCLEGWKRKKVNN